MFRLKVIALVKFLKLNFWSLVIACYIVKLQKSVRWKWTSSNSSKHLLTQLYSFLAKKSRENYITSNMIFFSVVKLCKKNYLVIDENKTPINKKSAVEFGGNLMNEVFFFFAFSQICIKFKKTSVSCTSNIKKRYL